MELSIFHAGYYNRPETYVQETLFAHIGLCVEGLDYMRFTAGEGKERCHLEVNSTPFLTLIPTGVRVDFRFNRKRENWVIQCRIPWLRQLPGEAYSLLTYEEAEIRIPFVVPVTVEQALVLRDTFDRIRCLWQNGTPASRFAAELLAAGVIGEIVDERTLEREVLTPAARLRELIDADESFRESLSDLSRAAGASAGYLRRCFREEYLIDPGEYRARKRLGRIMTLIGQGTMGLKEIAEEVGMKHVTHLHAFVRERCGVTPGELLKQVRRQSRPGPGPLGPGADS